MQFGHELNIDLDIEWSEKQWEALTFRAPPNADGSPAIAEVAMIGEFGGGKTHVAGARFFGVCTENPFIHGVHSSDDPPFSILVAPTFGDAKLGPFRELMKLLGPHEQCLVGARRMHGEDRSIELMNGHQIKVRSAGGALNGPSACQLWADEIQEKVYEGKWENLKKRVRDVRAQRLNVQVSGIAERGMVQDLFRLPEPAPSGVPYCFVDPAQPHRFTVLLFPEDNAPNMAAGYVDEHKSAMPYSRQRDKDGWLLPKDVVYPSWANSRNLRVPPGWRCRKESDLHHMPASIAVDFGRRASVLWVLPIGLRGLKGTKDPRGLFIVKQWMPREKDAEEIAESINKHSPFKRDPRQCFVFFDPDTKTDQIRHFRRLLPEYRPIQHLSGFYRLEENGERAVDRAVRDAHGNVRLYVAPWLRTDPSKRGVVEMFSGYTEKKKKDQLLEHAADTVRYAVQHFCPLPMSVEDIDREQNKRKRSRNPVTSVKISDLG